MTEEVYQSAMARMVVGGRQWSAELLVDGGWAGAAGASRRHHAWGGATLSVALVKWGSHGPRDSKVIPDIGGFESGLKELKIKMAELYLLHKISNFAVKHDESKSIIMIY